MSISPQRLKVLAERSNELVQPTSKLQVTMRIDADVLDWFRSQGKGYQARINAVLKAYMRSQSKR
jgi:uncharacterized protein (DUF4415 family)